MKVKDIYMAFNNCALKIYKDLMDYQRRIETDLFPTIYNSGREKEMGMVYQSEEMQKEIDEMLTEAGNVQLCSTEVNATTTLSLCACPLTYDVVLGGRNIVSLNNVENAIIIYCAMMADFKGEIYHG